MNYWWKNISSLEIRRNQALSGRYATEITLPCVTSTTNSTKYLYHLELHPLSIRREITEEARLKHWRPLSSMFGTEKSLRRVNLFEVKQSSLVLKKSGPLPRWMRPSRCSDSQPDETQITAFYLVKDYNKY